MILSKIRILSLSLLVCLAVSAAWADQVVLKNGDRVTGSIIKKDGKNLTIKTDHFGVVTTSWDQVESVRADKPVHVVHVVLADGKTVQGTLATTNGKVEVTTKDAKVSLAPADVATIRDDAEQKAYERLLKPGWGELWAGTARVTRTDKTMLYFNAIKASALVNGADAETARAVRGGIAYDHNLHPRLFVNVFNDYEFDKFQHLDLRFVLGGGFGWHAFKSARSRFDLLGEGI